MMPTSFERALAIVVGHEGGFGTERADPGNWTGGQVGAGELRGTKFGISAAAYPTLDIANLTLEVAADIYRHSYWDRVSADRLPPPLALLVFDAAVNNGVGRATEWLQQTLGVTIDRQIGPATLAALDHAAATQWRRRPLRRVPGPSHGLHGLAADLAHLRPRLVAPSLRITLSITHHGSFLMLPLIPLAISLAPEIAKWLFGPSAEKTTAAVAQVVSDVTGADISTDDGFAAAQSALGDKPELATRLRVQLAQIAADSERAERAADQATLAARFADVASARAQTVSLAQSKSAVQWAPVIISTVVLLTFGIVMWLALTHALPVGSETILNMLLGTLAAMATSVVAYWVGSSAGSATKTEMLYRSSPTS